MPEILYTDEEISELIAVPKPVDCGLLNDRISVHERQRNRQGGFSFAIENGQRFKGYMRQNLINSSDFSIGIGVPVPEHGNSMFVLRRYCGKGHEHQNRPGEERFVDFHVHTATEEFQLEPEKDDERYAERTDAYSDFEGAIKYMCSDMHILERSASSQLTLFESFINAWEEQ